MRINRLSLKNYRTFEDLQIEFHNSYTAICGQNDAGKSNIILALQVLLGSQKSHSHRRMFSKRLSLENDFPKWIPEERDKSICVSCELTIFSTHDAGLHSFLVKWLDIPEGKDILLTLTVSRKRKHANEVVIQFEKEKITGFEKEKIIGFEKEKITGLKAQEVYAKLKTAMIVHNSTEAGYMPSFIRDGDLDEFSVDHSKELAEIGKKASNSLKRVAKIHKDEITGLLGRLSREYKVGISLPDISINHLPYDLTLGDSQIDVSLSEWGSGTKNRTMILLALLKARKISQSVTTSSKATPILVIEEPESFLHPSAQAEFGRVLQDLSSEFKVQVISTTHSPYMLSRDKPESNILLKRKIVRNRHLRGSQQCSTEGENWMAPFSEILGLSSNEFRPWKELLFGNNESTLLVEGITDKDYFEMLRGMEHGNNRLKFEGTIFAYGGSGALKSPMIINFIKSRSKTSFITYDLDVESTIKEKLERNGLVYKYDFLGLGQNKPGKRTIEGLLPTVVLEQVDRENHDLVQQAIHGSLNEKESAKNNLKQCYLSKFMAECKPTAEWFGEFYKAVKIINAGLKVK